MIGLRDELEDGSGTKGPDGVLKKVKIGEGVPGTLKKQHGDGDLRKMGCTRHGRLPRRMEWKREEDETSHAGKRAHCLSLRGHAPAEGAASREQRQACGPPLRLGDGGAHGRVRRVRRVGPPASTLHERKLVAERGDAKVGQPVGERRHGAVRHPRARSMGEDETGEWVVRGLPQARDSADVSQVQREGRRIHGITMKGASSPDQGGPEGRITARD